MKQQNQQSHLLSNKLNQIDTTKQYSNRKLWLYVISLALGSFQLGYGLGVYNPISKVLMKKYSFSCNNCWNIDYQNREPYNTIVSASLFIGAFISSIISNYIIKKSRITSLYVLNILCIIGSSMQLFISLPPLIAGRFIQGLGVGGFTNLIPPMINQISPPIVRGRLGTIVQIAINFGFFASAAMGFGLPHNARQISRDGDDILWRVIIGFPIFVGLLMVMIFLFCYNYDTPTKYIQKGQHELALKALEIVYEDNHSATLRLNQIERENTINKISHEKLSDNPKIVLFICTLLGIFQQLTGVNAVSFYSTQIFQNNIDKEDIYDGKLIAVLTTSIGMVVALFSLVLIERCGRKPLLVIGCIIMTISMFLSGLFQLTDQNNFEKVFIVVFIVGFQMSMGPIFWAYLPEVINSTGISVCNAAIWVTLIGVSLTVPALQKWKGQMLLGFSGLNLLGALFVIFFIIQTKGKTRGQVSLEYVNKFQTGKA